jgi:hypothetical protein
MQKLPIGSPDPVPKRKFIVQMKTHGRADARGLTGPEMADRALAAKERAEKAEQPSQKEEKQRPASPEDDDGVRLIPDTPPGATLGPEGENQGGTTIALALGSPRRPSPPPVPSFRGSPLPKPFRDLPASIAPARLTTRVRRPHVKTTRAKESREDGYLLESQSR